MATMGSRVNPQSVCVIGSGVLGLVATKNLVEQGLEVQILEKNGYIGGIWHVTEDIRQTSALSGTRAQFSKLRSAFTDFPMPDDYPEYPSSKDYEQYLESYARHFNLIPRIKFHTVVTKIQRDDLDHCWLVFTKDTDTNNYETVRQFDKVVIATGINGPKNDLLVAGAEAFQGQIIHSQQLRDFSRYKEQTVLVVGCGPTGVDTLQFLEQAGAERLYLSHRSALTVLPLSIRGQPSDLYLTRRMSSIFRLLAQISPWLACLIFGVMTKLVERTTYPFLKSITTLSKRKGGQACFLQGFIGSDRFPYQLRDGVVHALPRIKRITGPSTVLFEDDKEVKGIDAIILCTGYYQDYCSLIEGRGNPADPSFAYDGFQQFQQTRFRKPKEQYPRLYQGLLSEKYPDSLAVLGHLAVFKSIFVQYDLATMAVASLWAGNYPLPSAAEMKKEIDAHYQLCVQTLQSTPMPYIGYRLNDSETERWLNVVAGTGVDEYLGVWRLKAWKFWFADRQMYSKLMDGPDTPTIYRLFDTGRGRRPWTGARKAIEATNRQVRAKQ